jgi:hypothetical protein
MSSCPAKPHARACRAARTASWPEGATAGLLFLAAASIALSATLYHVAGPREVIAEGALAAR